MCLLQLQRAVPWPCLHQPPWPLQFSRLPSYSEAIEAMLVCGPHRWACFREIPHGGKQSAGVVASSS